MELREGCKQTEVGVLPEDWDAKRLTSVCSMKSGEAITSANIHQGAKYPCYGGNGLRGYSHHFTHDGHYSLIGRQGALCGNVLSVQGQFFASEHAIVVTPAKETKIDWLTYVLGRMNLNQYSESSAQPGLSISKLLPLVIPVPPTKTEQTAIANALSDADAWIQSLTRLIVKKRQIKQGAMQTLLNPYENGRLKAGWVEKKLGDVGQFKNGINKGSGSFGHGRPFINLLDVFGKNTLLASDSFGLVDSTDTECNTYDLKKGDVIFIRSSVKPSGVGLTAVVEGDLHQTVYSGFLIRFRDNGGIVANYKKYCFYEEGFREKVISASTVSANTNINQDSLKNLSFAFPSTKTEQTHIATILSDMDKEITALESKLTKAQQIKQGMMQNLLTGRIRLVKIKENAS